MDPMWSHCGAHVLCQRCHDATDSVLAGDTRDNAIDAEQIHVTLDGPAKTTENPRKILGKPIFSDFWGIFN